MMEIFNMLQNIRSYKPFQEKTGKRNRAVLHGLRGLGFSLPCIRKALINLERITVRDIANSEVSIPTIHNTINGGRLNKIVKALIAGRLQVETAELFPENRALPR
jgi:hypothetical protein